MDKRTPRRSKRIRKKGQEEFEMPSREEVLDKIEVSPGKKVDHLRPKKLINNFVVENYSYNNRSDLPPLSDDSDGLEEFIDSSDVTPAKRPRREKENLSESKRKTPRQKVRMYGSDDEDQLQEKRRSRRLSRQPKKKVIKYDKKKALDRIFEKETDLREVVESDDADSFVCDDDESEDRSLPSESEDEEANTEDIDLNDDDTANTEEIDLNDDDTSDVNQNGHGGSCDASSDVILVSSSEDIQNVIETVDLEKEHDVDSRVEGDTSREVSSNTKMEKDSSDRILSPGKVNTKPNIGDHSGDLGADVAESSDESPERNGAPVIGNIKKELGTLTTRPPAVSFGEEMVSNLKLETLSSTFTGGILSSNSGIKQEPVGLSVMGKGARSFKERVCTVQEEITPYDSNLMIKQEEDGKDNSCRSNGSVGNEETCTRGMVGSQLTMVDIKPEITGEGQLITSSSSSSTVKQEPNDGDDGQESRGGGNPSSCHVVTLPRKEHYLFDGTNGPAGNVEIQEVSEQANHTPDQISSEIKSGIRTEQNKGSVMSETRNGEIDSPQLDDIEHDGENQKTIGASSSITDSEGCVALSDGSTRGQVPIQPLDEKIVSSDVVQNRTTKMDIKNLYDSGADVLSSDSDSGIKSVQGFRSKVHRRKQLSKVLDSESESDDEINNSFVRTRKRDRRKSATIESDNSDDD